MSSVHSGTLLSDEDYSDYTDTPFEGFVLVKSLGVETIPVVEEFSFVDGTEVVPLDEISAIGVPLAGSLVVVVVPLGGSPVVVVDPLVDGGGPP